MMTHESIRISNAYNGYKMFEGRKYDINNTSDKEIDLVPAASDVCM